MNERVSQASRSRACESDADLEAMIAVRAAADPDRPPPRLENLRHNLAANETLVYVVARLDGEPAGCGVRRSVARRSSPEAHLVVVPALRRRGIGSALLAELGRRRVDCRLGRELEGEVVESDVESREYLERRGYRRSWAARRPSRSISTAFEPEPVEPPAGDRDRRPRRPAGARRAPVRGRRRGRRPTSRATSGRHELRAVARDRARPADPAARPAASSRSRTASRSGMCSMDDFGRDGYNGLTAVAARMAAPRHRDGAQADADRRGQARRLRAGSSPGSEERNLPMRTLNAKLGYRPEPSRSTLTMRGPADVRFGAWPRLRTGARPTPGSRSSRSTRPDDVADLELELPGEFPFTRGPYRDMYRGRPWTIRQYAGFALGRGDERALPLPARARPDRPLGRVRPADPARLRLGRPARAWARSAGPGVAIDSIADMELLFDGIPLGEVSTSMTINAPASLLLLLYELVAEDAGRRRRRAPRHGPERHPQGVHRARELHLPAAAVDADHDRPLRVLRGAAAALEHDLDLRLPHPRGRLDGGAGARVHARERHRVLRRRRSTRASRRTSSARGSRSSSTRTTTSSRRWRSSARRGGSGRGSCASGSARRTRRRSRCASTRRRAARRSPRSSPRTTSCASRSRRSSAVCGGAQSLHTNGVRRGARAADRARRRGSRCARSRSSRTRRAAPTPPTRSAARTSSRR